MSGEGLLSSDRQRDPGTCLCGRAMVDRYAPCGTCADDHDYRPGDHVAWTRDLPGDFLHQPHEDFSVND